MYMIRFHIRITLRPTAPSMFQNQKLKKKKQYNLGKKSMNIYQKDLKNILRGKNETYLEEKYFTRFKPPEEKGIESFVP